MRNLTQYLTKSFRFILLLLCVGVFVMCGGDSTDNPDNTEYAYLCSFGTPVRGTTDTESTQKCESCDGSYDLENSRCVQACTVDDFVEKLTEETPNVLGCSQNSIDNIDFSVLRTEGHSSQMYLL